MQKTQQKKQVSQLDMLRTPLAKEETVTQDQKDKVPLALRGCISRLEVSLDERGVHSAFCL